MKAAIPLIIFTVTLVATGPTRSNEADKFETIRKLLDYQGDYRKSEANSYQYYKAVFGIRREFRKIDLLPLSEFRSHGIDPEIIMKVIDVTAYWIREPSDAEFLGMAKPSVNPEIQKAAEEALLRIKAKNSSTSAS